MEPLAAGLTVEQAWIFERLAVTLARIDFLDPALAGGDDVRERGVRLELRPVEADRAGSIYASWAQRLEPGVWRIDLLESAPYAADRMHWHPIMEAGEPGERTFDEAMARDPLRWLEEHLRQIEEVREAVDDIVAAAARGLAWARVDPWPEVTRDERGLATS